jgi:N-acetylglucosaminyl-diphospho-decaprenol L-rhamnosyltransferase
VADEPLERRGRSATPELSVVVVNHDGADCLSRTLGALAAGTRAEAECLVVDSGSSDGSWRAVERHWDRARAIRFEQNIGFCAGCNRGVEAAAAPLVAFVNFDGEVEPGWDVPLREALADPGNSVAGGMLVEPSGETVEALGLAIAPNLATYGLLEGSLRASVKLAPVEVSAVSGALMMVRREEFLALGGFYERFWMFGEEADLCLRMTGRVVADPRSAIRHEMGHAAGPRGSETRVYWPSRNRLINAARHLDGTRLAASVLTSAAFDAALVAGRRDRATVASVLRGWRDGLRLMPAERAWRAARGRPTASRRLVSLREALAQQRRLASRRRKP